ncbi:MAG: hypothetical protein OXC13_11650 [Caldilineaceae bacterium]|nr:hypothetical protein [Caldilineaceae bacterium]
MTWSEYGHLLLRHGWLMVAAAAVCGALALGLTTVQEPVFRARVRISMLPGVMDWRMRDLTKELARNAVATFPSDELLAAVRDQTGLQTNADGLRAGWDDGELIITIEAFAGDAATAGTLARTAATAFHSRRSLQFTEQEFIEFIEFEIRNREPELQQIAPNVMTNVLAGLFVGFAAGLTLVLILHWRDEEWLLTRQAIEKSVPQPVLGSIRLN